MHTPQPSWFTQEELAGLPDFWRVYDAHYFSLGQTAVEKMRGEPHFAVLLGSMSAEHLREEQRRDHERIARAMSGDWSEYVENLKRQGTSYARLGIPLTVWYGVVRGVTRDLMKLLFTTFAKDPDRLRGALLGMHAFFDCVMSVLAEVYLEASQEALVRSETRFQRLSDAGFLGVIKADMAGHVLEANDAFLTLIGRTREELKAGLFTRDITPKEWRPVDALACKDLETTGISQPHEKEYSRPNGEHVPVLVGGALLDENSVIAFALDLTQQKQLERFRARSLRLEVENRRVHEASRLKSEFLANMSHELRTPLNAIIGFTELIHSQQVTPDMPQFEEFVGDILASSRHLLQLINDVLDLSKVEAGRLEFHAEVVDLPRVVQEVVAILRTIAAQKHIKVSVEVDPSLGQVFIDAARLKQVLYNYVSNALKFTGPGGKVLIRAKPEEPGFFRLEVEDTGIGITTADIDKLFSEFQQLDAGASKAQPGTGLGLALTKRLTEAQGGSVGVTSAPGKGSTFFALLPRRAVSGEPVAAPRSVAGMPGAPSILVVEDEPNDQSLIMRTLTDAGYSVDTASTGTQALARCRAQHYDAITLDLLLPDANGLEVLQAIRQSPLNRDVPVIVITVVTEGGAAAGFTVHDILPKPVSAPSILGSLERAGVHSERGGRVLVVDDDAASTRLMSATLDQLGYRATTAHRGAEGLAIASEDPPIAVILDLLMPEMDGFEFLERFRALPRCKTVPVIVWTVKELSVADYRRLEASVQGILQKGKHAGTVVLEALRMFLPAHTAGG
ncbi:MAG: response regulator [Archangium sp.]|nr:response regulator [Archangium sp.]